MSRSFSWWVRFFRSVKKSAERPSKRAISRARTRPAFDTLEDRCVPATYNVDLATDENDGNTAAGDLCLREAINLANANPGVDTLNFTLNASTANAVQRLTLGTINITQSVNIVVNFPELSQVRISGNNASQIFNLTGAGTVVSIQGVTLENGRGQFGGAISVNSGTTLNLTQCVLRDNVAQGSAAGPGLGGALANDLGTVVIDRCAFINNQALGENGQDGSATGGGGGGGGGAGAGGAIWTDASLTISNSTFSGNLARGVNGGAIYQPRTGRGILTITNSLIDTNSATNGGGGVFSDSPQPNPFTIDHSTISNNTGNVFGGGVVHYDGGTTGSAVQGFITYSTISNNRAIADVGGGVVVDGAGSIVYFNSSTISGNTAVLQGGGVFVRGSSFQTNFVNVTLSGNSSRTFGGGIYNQSTVAIYASTITLNGADSDNNSGSETGGGIYTFSGRLTTLYNTIVAGNFVNAALITAAAVVSNDIAGTNVQAASVNNLISEPTAAGGLTNGVNGNIVGDAGQTLDITTVLDIDILDDGPTFATGPEQGLNDNGSPTKTHALVQNSRAIGAGLSFANFYDQRDVLRDPTAPDIGAYEVQHPLAPVGTPSTYANTFLPKPSASANEAFIKGLYQSTLLRAPDAAGLAGWVNILNGGAVKTDVAFGFVNSAENRTNQVTFFYTYFLGRSPDPVGLSGWVAILQGGADEGTVMSGFLLSPEFTGQNSNASFVNLMYYALLGRQAEPSGFNGWLGFLNSGQMTREQVGNGFLRSPESITRVVIADFGSYLKRTITPAAAQPYVAQIQAGTTFGRVAANILGSEEFFLAAGQNL